MDVRHKREIILFQSLIPLDEDFDNFDLCVENDTWEEAMSKFFEALKVRVSKTEKGGGIHPNDILSRFDYERFDHSDLDRPDVYHKVYLILYRMETDAELAERLARWEDFETNILPQMTHILSKMSYEELDELSGSIRARFSTLQMESFEQVASSTTGK